MSFKFQSSSIMLAIVEKGTKWCFSLGLNMSYLWVFLFYSITAVAQECKNTNETNLEEAVQTLRHGSITFSFNMLRVLNKEMNGKQFFFAPHGIWYALLLVSKGARGATHLEIQRVLNTKGIHNRDAMTLIKGEHSSSHIFFQKGSKIYNECDLLEDISFVDYDEKPQEAQDIINAWAENATHGRITDLVPFLHPQTRMVIVNAVYFREDWLHQFNVTDTRKWRFTMATRREIWVNMMGIRGHFLYGQSEKLQCRALELPYADEKLAMLILLPYNRYSGINVLAKSLTNERLEDLLQSMQSREVSVRLPRFKIESEFELNNALYQLGLRTLFDSSKADLSGFSGKPEYSVDSVKHKTYVLINEEGTEATAATAVVSSRNARPLGPASFISDYPFIFLIRDSTSELVLFIGIVHEPTHYAPPEY